MAVIAHKDIGFPNETFRVVDSLVGSWSDSKDLAAKPQGNFQ